MADKRLTKEGREIATLDAVMLLDNLEGSVTMSRVARYCGLKPSSYLMGVLFHLNNTGEIDLSFGRCPNGSEVYLWRYLCHRGRHSDEIPF